MKRGGKKGFKWVWLMMEWQKCWSKGGLTFTWNRQSTILLTTHTLFTNWIHCGWDWTHRRFFFGVFCESTVLMFSPSALVWWNCNALHILVCIKACILWEYLSIPKTCFSICGLETPQGSLRGGYSVSPSKANNGLMSVLFLHQGTAAQLGTSPPHS